MSRPARLRKGERGSALLIVFVLAAIVAIALYTELPIASFEAKRQREETLVYRGGQYAQAVRLYYRALKSYPPSIEALENTNRQRFLRKRFKDPLTGKDEWRLLHAAPNGVIIDSKVNPINANPNGNTPGLSGSGQNAVGPNASASTGIGFGNSNANGLGFNSAGAGANGFNGAGSNGFNSNGSNPSGFNASPSGGGIGFASGASGPGASNPSLPGSPFSNQNGSTAQNGFSSQQTGSGASFGGYYSQPAKPANPIDRNASRAAALGTDPAADPASSATGVENPTTNPSLAGVNRRAPAITAHAVAPTGTDSSIDKNNDDEASTETLAEVGAENQPAAEAGPSGGVTPERRRVSGGQTLATGSGPLPNASTDYTASANTPGSATPGGNAPGTNTPSFGQVQAAANGSGAFGNTVSTGTGFAGGTPLNGGAGIAGVASKAAGVGIKTVNDQTQYSLWEFFYDPSKDPIRGITGLQGGGGTNQRGANTNSAQSGGSGIGSSASATAFGNGFRPGGGFGTNITGQTNSPSNGFGSNGFGSTSRSDTNGFSSFGGQSNSASTPPGTPQTTATGSGP